MGSLPRPDASARRPYLPRNWFLPLNMRAAYAVLNSYDFSPSATAESKTDTLKAPSLPVFNSLVVMAVDSMLRRGNRAQAGIQRLHHQALVGAECSRVGIWLGLSASSKPDTNTGRRKGEGVGHGAVS